jgi:excisionase family DNA binding protein
MKPEKVNYNITEAAAALGIARSTLYNCLLFRSDFPAYKIGERTVIPVKALHAWAAEQGQRKEGF